MANCTMIMIEDVDMNLYWECDCCESKFQDRDDFDQSKECPNCKSTITDWEFISGYEDEEMGEEELEEDEDE